ncbi:hypothetical protein CesoFtcFv8_023483 [Champsocephalus esox]|uniref:Uncharacterized protein n=1 Tax=Champsocephalus esox TaxID=159716 RepID=A0AAN8GIJ2_9TELE|nr:hypothetical protein CesoFtcFv8_023483 [Champsocephalus esox]
MLASMGMADMLGWVSSPEVGTISLVVFFIIGVALLGLCARCQRNTGNAYDVNATVPDVERGANGNAGVNVNTGANDPGDSTTWRNHRNMPPSTLERSRAEVE